MKIRFGARATITAPDEENSDYEGKTGIIVRELEADATGLRRVQIAFEGEAFQPLFYLHELVQEAGPAPQRTIERIVEKKVFVERPLPPTRAMILRAVRRLLAETMERMDAEEGVESARLPTS